MLIERTSTSSQAQIIVPIPEDWVRFLMWIKSKRSWEEDVISYDFVPRIRAKALAANLPINEVQISKGAVVRGYTRNDDLAIWLIKEQGFSCERRINTYYVDDLMDFIEDMGETTECYITKLKYNSLLLSRNETVGTMFAIKYPQAMVNRW